MSYYSPHFKQHCLEYLPHVNQKPTKRKEKPEFTKQAYKHKHVPNPLNHYSKPMILPGCEVNQESKMNRSSLTHDETSFNTVELQALKILEERYWNWTSSNDKIETLQNIFQEEDEQSTMIN
ncbi:hypothetical protein Ddye_030302 [Dipteronia dyeriana]|uniref:Uncharacterized protein n=1 Tax=Dipteronia dyeriana TaxID=168575 RepID=A0AAD9TG33_9ROSI|nr:hypothetical protein Ddye_030302 [Dipteronia dyeriana]